MFLQRQGEPQERLEHLLLVRANDVHWSGCNLGTSRVPAIDPVCVALVYSSIGGPCGSSSSQGAS